MKKEIRLDEYTKQEITLQRAVTTIALNFAVRFQKEYPDYSHAFVMMEDLRVEIKNLAQSERDKAWSEAKEEIESLRKQLEEAIRQRDEAGAESLEIGDKYREKVAELNELRELLKEYHDWHIRCIEGKQFSPVLAAPIRVKARKLLRF